MTVRTKETMVRSSSRVWPVLMVLAILGVAVGGCGTISSGLASDSPVPISGALVAAQTEPEPSESSVSTNADEPAAAPVVISYEPITAENAPAWVVALSGPVDPALRGTPEAIPPDPDVEEYDPWESFNEKMFTFNYNLDRYGLKPLAKGYNFVMPDMFQIMIDNAFTNLKMPVRFVNKVLQWKLLDATKEMGRFIINSTLGIGGLFDVAEQEMGLERQKADFGQTLGVWGAGPGPYLVLPLLPPLTIRDAIGYQRSLAQPRPLPGHGRVNGRSLQRCSQRLSPASQPADQGRQVALTACRWIAARR
jgi:ABC-type transporter lipoprotein component MlaA